MQDDDIDPWEVQANAEIQHTCPPSFEPPIESLHPRPVAVAAHAPARRTPASQHPSALPHPVQQPISLGQDPTPAAISAPPSVPRPHPRPAQQQQQSQGGALALPMHSGVPPAVPRPTAQWDTPHTALAPMSLEAYMLMHAAVTRGASAVRQCAPVESAKLRASDLKQVLTLHGHAAGSWTKQALLERMEGLDLFDPFHINDYIPSQAELEPGRTLTLGIEAGCLAALGWAVAGKDLEVLLRPSNDPCAASPEILVPSELPPAREETPAAAAAAMPAEVASDSDMTALSEDSSPAVGGGEAEVLQSVRPSPGLSPGVEEGVREKVWLPSAATPWTPSSPCKASNPGASASTSNLPAEAAHGAPATDRSLAPPPPPSLLTPVSQSADEAAAVRSKQPDTVASATEAAEAAVELAAAGQPKWLACAVPRLLRGSQVCGAPLTAPLVGRKVAFALLEDLTIREQRSTQTMRAGLHIGRVLECLGPSHQPEFCEAGCVSAHSFHYVRLRPDGSEAGARRYRGIDLKLDLHLRLRARTSTALLQLTPDALEEAWLLLKPQLVDEGLGPPADAAATGDTASAAGAAVLDRREALKPGVAPRGALKRSRPHTHDTPPLDPVGSAHKAPTVKPAMALNPAAHGMPAAQGRDSAGTAAAAKPLAVHSIGSCSVALCAGSVVWAAMGLTAWPALLTRAQYQGVVGLRLFGVSTELELPAEVVAPFCCADFAVRTAQLASETGQRAVKDALAYVELIGTAGDKDWLAAIKLSGLPGG